MTIATLSEVLQPALRDGYAVAGLVTLGWEDMRAFVAAAEAENVPGDPSGRPRVPGAHAAAGPGRDVSLSGRTLPRFLSLPISTTATPSTNAGKRSMPGSPR